jgi:hypothetical protein
MEKTTLCLCNLDSGESSLGQTCSPNVLAIRIVERLSSELKNDDNDDDDDIVDDVDVDVVSLSYLSLSTSPGFGGFDDTVRDPSWSERRVVVPLNRCCGFVGKPVELLLNEYRRTGAVT